MIPPSDEISPVLFIGINYTPPFWQKQDEKEDFWRKEANKASRSKVTVPGNRKAAAVCSSRQGSGRSVVVADNRQNPRSRVEKDRAERYITLNGGYLNPRGREGVKVDSGAWFGVGCFVLLASVA